MCIGGRATAGVRAASLVAAVLAVSFLAGSTATMSGDARPATERVWGDGMEWEVQIGGAATVRARWQPFYLIAPIVAGSPQSLRHWGFGPHDHVMHVPPHVRGDGTGPCQALLVVPGPNGVPGVNIEVVPDPDVGIPFVRAVDRNGDGVLESLTSAAAVEASRAAGLVSFFEPQPGGAPIVFLCPVRPLHG